jgi:DNA-binding transcriptional LysR family regulator
MRSSHRRFPLRRPVPPKSMQLQQINYFLLLCEERSFTRAARRCNVAQPSLTKAIRRLEKELGGPLFRRRPSIELSELGEAVRPHLEQIVWAVNNARHAASEVTAPCCREPGETSPHVNGESR